MHEVSIVQALIEQVGEEVTRAGEAGRVVALDLAIGRLSGVHADSIRFAFELLSRETVVADAELRIREPQAILACGDCGARETIAELVLRCPRCLSGNVRLEGGRELLLESIELEQP